MDMYIFSFKQIVHYYVSKSSPVYVGFIDASKAFDRVNHYKLFGKMLKWGVPNTFFPSLLSILFCNAVPGVGGTVCGVFNDKDSKRKGWGRGGEENKFSAAPSTSV